MTVTATEGLERPAETGALLDRLADWTVAPRSSAFRWSFVATIFAVATALRFLLDSLLPAGFPFLTFFPAIAITAFVAGNRAGMAVATLCLGVAWYFFIPPVNSLALAPGQALALLLYVVVVGTELGLVYLMRRALRRLAEAEARAREQARSRSLMFHELQHRVSNNLAVVGSLLSMQRREVRDPDARRALEAAVARVNVVSRLNRLLHDPQAQQVDFGAFLRAMVPDAVAAAGAADRVEVTVVAEPLVLPADKAVPLGLVTTELLANAIEHGFPDGRAGTVRVSLAMMPEGQARLEVRDDGAGLPPGFDLERARSLGLLVARQFAEQLGGTLRIVEDGGVVSRLDLPVA